MAMTTKRKETRVKENETQALKEHIGARRERPVLAYRQYRLTQNGPAATYVEGKLGLLSEMEGVLCAESK